MKQLALLKKQPSAYGGELLKTRKGRSRPRPLSTRETMHLVLRSSKAQGAWSFRRRENAEKIRRIALKFSRQYGIQILSLANVGNHLHFHLKLSNRFTYKPFIRALTASIAMAITGASRWKPLHQLDSRLLPPGGHPSSTRRHPNPARRQPTHLDPRQPSSTRRHPSSTRPSPSLKQREPGPKAQARFWDYRPFTRVIQGLRALLTLKDYIRINQYEGQGVSRAEAEFLVFWEKGGVRWAEEPC